jgi:hypothetical protein
MPSSTKANMRIKKMREMMRRNKTNENETLFEVAIEVIIVEKST